MLIPNLKSEIIHKNLKKIAKTKKKHDCCPVHSDREFVPNQIKNYFFQIQHHRIDQREKTLLNKKFIQVKNRSKFVLFDPTNDLQIFIWMRIKNSYSVQLN